MTVTWHTGDSREVMATIADGSVDLIATSPPFLALRSYLPAGHDQKHAEIGSEANPAAYIDMLLNLTTEWGRVLAPHGSIAIELGDTYSGSGGGGGDYLPGGLRENQPGFGGSAERQREGNAAHWRAKNQTPDAWPRAKCLALIPQLYAVALAYGINPLTGQPSPAGRWLVRNVIVWHRPNPAVGALGDKVRPSTSYIVIATRSPKRWFDLTAVRTPTDRYDLGGNGGREFAGGRPGGDERGGPHSAGSNPAGAPPLDTWTDEYDGTHDTWTLTTQPSPLAHYAMWPAKLAERLILMMCPSQVCRVCGVPRRRVEGKTPEYAAARDEVIRTTTRTARDVAVENGGPFSRGAGVGSLIAHGRVDTSPLTLGWSDCGHGCPTCGGLNQIPDDPAYSTDSECPDCTDGRAFRPGLVLDPFAGSGTTLAVADLHGRDAIGIDLDPRNHDLYPARYHEVKKALYGTPAPQPGQGVLAL